MLQIAGLAVHNAGTNLEGVACCHGCNRRKSNRMLSDIDDMALLRDPRPFSLHTSRQIMRMLGRGDDRWRKYLFY